MFLDTFQPIAEIVVMPGGAILPTPAVPVSTKISARMNCVQEHDSPVKVVGRCGARTVVNSRGRALLLQRIGRRGAGGAVKCAHG